MRKPKVSVIVPVFNGETFVSECIESLLVQTLRDIEIILVDDGSTDGTGRICREYASSDDRIILIQQVNAGVSAARNAGLRVAKGEYLAFADADDLVPADGLKALFDAGMERRADLVIGDYTVTRADEVTLVRPVRSVLAQDWVCSILDGRNHSALWNKMMRRESLGMLRFPDDIRYAEDQVLLVKFYLSKPLNFAFVDTPVYTHRLSAGSATGSGGAIMFDLLRAKIYIANLIIDAGMTSTLGPHMKRGSGRAVLSVVRNIDLSLSFETKTQLHEFASAMKNMGFPIIGVTRARVLIEISKLPYMLWALALRKIQSVWGKSA